MQVGGVESVLEHEGTGNVQREIEKELGIYRSWYLGEIRFYAVKCVYRHNGESLHWTDLITIPETSVGLFSYFGASKMTET